MKILFISMASIHARRWIENMNDSNHELFWFDILGRGEMEVSFNITQIVNWNKRKIKYIKGEYFLRKKIPSLYYKIQPFLEKTIEEKLEEIILKIKPDVVHSFEMQSCSYPILNTMLKYPKLTWVYSCWGSDLYYYKNLKNHNRKIKQVLKRVNFLHTDCLRDFELAKLLGFSGEFLGIIPGGAGYDIEGLEKKKKPLNSRKVILVKGYEHTFGRALNVIKALNLLEHFIADYKVIVFAAHKVVKDFIDENKLPFQVYEKDTISHNEILKLMGESKIYIGNSISDGMPNTLLEALVMGAFPIQSNPGNVTSEIIIDGLNGLLINKPNDVEYIKNILFKVLNKDSEIDFNTSIKMNVKIANERLDDVLNKDKIIELYMKIEKKLE